MTPLPEHNWCLPSATTDGVRAGYVRSFELQHRKLQVGCALEVLVGPSYRPGTTTRLVNSRRRRRSREAEASRPPGAHFRSGSSV